MLDVLSVSDMCVDLVISGNVRPEFHQVEQLVEDYSLEMGGSANIFASQFAKLGGQSGLVGYVGRDGFGIFLQEKLQKIGVDTSHIQVHPSLKTGISAILAEPSDRAILTYLGTIDAVTPQGLSQGLLANCRHWHIASYFLLGQLRGYWKQWLKQCQEDGITISLDTNWDPENRWEGVSDLLPLVDVFLPNEAEARGIAGEQEVRKAAEKLSALGPLVVVKSGEKGSIACYQGELWECPPETPQRIVDAVGAGDNFDAGFVFSWMRGKSIPESLALATRCAVSSLGAAGGIEGQLLFVD
jgi:sugar/nucleoside kinase (ribokinase family)